MGCACSSTHTSPQWKYQPFFPFIHAPRRLQAPIRRAVAIVNPRSGGNRGLQAVEALTAALLPLGVCVTVKATEFAGHAVDIAEALLDTPEAYDCVICVGGDGTVHEVVNGLALGMVSKGIRRQLPPVAVLPCGSGNNLCLNVGIFNLEDTVAAIMAGQYYAMDLLEIRDPSDAATPVNVVSLLEGEDVAESIKLRASLERGSGAGAAAMPGDGATALVATAAVPVATTAAAPVAAGAAAAPTAVLVPAEGAGAAGATRADIAAPNTTGPEDGAGAAVVAHGAGAVATAAAPTTAPQVPARQLMARVQYSMNLAGWALSVAVQLQAESLRWCGGVQYDMASYAQLLRNAKWLAGYSYVDPAGGRPLPVSHSQHAEAWHALNPPAGAPKTTIRTAPMVVPGGSTAVSSAAPAVSPAVIPAAPVPTSAAALTVPTPLATPHLHVIWHAQLTAYMGANMAFCPYAKLDDGFMDICAVSDASRMELIRAMGHAKDAGRHVVGYGATPETSNALPFLVYGQARELVIWPANEAEIRAWKAGAELGIPSATQPGVIGPTDAAAARGRAGIHVPPEPMIGARSLNVDGQVHMNTPARIKVLERVLPLLCAPVRVPVSR